MLRRLRRGIGRSLGKQRVQIKRAGEHGELAVGRARPVVRVPIPIQFHAVVVRIAQVNRLAHPVIRRAFKPDARAQYAAQRIRQRRARGINNRQVVKARRSRRRRCSAQTFPGVQRNVVMVAARGKKCRAVAVTLRHFKSQNAAIKFQRPRKFRHLQVDMANPRGGMDGTRQGCKFLMGGLQHAITRQIPQACRCAFVEPSIRDDLEECRLR